MYRKPCRKHIHTQVRNETSVGPKVTIPGLCVLMITKHIKAIWY